MTATQSISVSRHSIHLTPDYQTTKRMDAKMQAVPLPYMLGKSVLDVGTDMGHWAFLAAQQGAARVVGLDRNRDVRGHGRVDLVALNRERAAFEGRDNVTFAEINLGRQWHDFGRFDVVLVLSVYHHVFEQCGDHAAVWFWLHRHCAEGGQVLWEGPVSDADPVVRANVSDGNRPFYIRDEILTAAQEYFEAEYIGPALHEPTREVWRFKPLLLPTKYTDAVMQAGAGGATPAFEHEAGRRIHEIHAILGVKPVAGSLNLRLDGPFDWDRGYLRSQVLDVQDRAAGLSSAWAPRWARFYPITIDEVPAWAFRFEGERYDRKFMELIAPMRLRDAVQGPRVKLAR